jgi:hypothetical protein
MSTDAGRESLQEKIWATAETLREAYYQEGAMSYWMGANKEIGDEVGYHLAGAGKQECESEYERAVRDLNDLYRRFRELGGSKEQFLDAALDPTSNNWPFRIRQDGFPWLTDDDITKWETRHPEHL